MTYVEGLGSDRASRSIAIHDLQPSGLRRWTRLERLPNLRAEQAETRFPAVRGPLRITDALAARSASSPVSGSTTPRPVDSTSSTNGVGAEKPVPIDARTVQRSVGRNTADKRGLKKVP